MKERARTPSGKIAFFAVSVSVVGAALDFTSAFLIWREEDLGSSMMMQPSSTSMQAEWLVALLVLLGLVVLFTGLLYLSSFGMMRMRPRGILMVFYGIAMIGSGLYMIAGLQIMSSASLSTGFGVAMLVVATLMILLGFGMTWRSKEARNAAHSTKPL